jgi:hypothetical protein
VAAVDQLGVQAVETGLRGLEILEDRQAGRTIDHVAAAAIRAGNPALPEIGRIDHVVIALPGGIAKIFREYSRIAARNMGIPGPVAFPQRTGKACHDLPDVIGIDRFNRTIVVEYLEQGPRRSGSFCRSTGVCRHLGT